MTTTKKKQSDKPVEVKTWCKLWSQSPEHIAKALAQSSHPRNHGKRRPVLA